MTMAVENHNLRRVTMKMLLICPWLVSQTSLTLHAHALAPMTLMVWRVIAAYYLLQSSDMVKVYGDD